jgi:hypothetical protein
MLDQEEVESVMKEWGFQDAATAESFLKTRQRKQGLAAAQARKQLMKVAALRYLQLLSQ